MLYTKEKIKNAWYRFYFFLNPKIKNYQKLRFKIIKLLKDNNIKCFTGACPEIYLEKSFKNLKSTKFKRLKNCKLLGDISLALDVNHTLSNYENHKNQIKLKNTLKKIFGH